MKIVKHIILVAALGAMSNYALADTTQTLTVGALPSSVFYGNNFASAATGSTFFDDYNFTIPSGFASSLTSSVNLGSILGLSDLRARVYLGTAHNTGSVAPGEVVSGWGTTVNYNPTTSLTTVVLPTQPLAAGTYTLQIKGTVVGASGGSYSGVLNVAQVPEPESYGMLLAGLTMIGSIIRRKSKY